MSATGVDPAGSAAPQRAALSATPGTGSFRSMVRFDFRRPVVANVPSHRATTVFVVCLDVGQELPEHAAPAEFIKRLYRAA